MARSTFTTVWFLPNENRWRDLNIFAMRDIGILQVHDESLEFQGKKENIRITNVKRITYGKQGRDFVNNWVKIQYRDGETAFFADGSWLGWGGMFGGTKKIHDAVCHLECRANSGSEKKCKRTARAFFSRWARCTILCALCVGIFGGIICIAMHNLGQDTTAAERFLLGAGLGLVGGGICGSVYAMIGSMKMGCLSMFWGMIIGAVHGAFLGIILYLSFDDEAVLVMGPLLGGIFGAIAKKVGDDITSEQMPDKATEMPAGSSTAPLLPKQAQSVVLQCPNCQQKLRMNRTKLGKQITCPKCDRTFEAQQESGH